MVINISKVNNNPDKTKKIHFQRLWLKAARWLHFKSAKTKKITFTTKCQKLTCFEWHHCLILLHKSLKRSASDYFFTIFTSFSIIKSFVFSFLLTWNLFNLHLKYLYHKSNKTKIKNVFINDFAFTLACCTNHFLSKFCRNVITRWKTNERKNRKKLHRMTFTSQFFFVLVVVTWIYC